MQRVAAYCEEMIETTSINIHWGYYIALESDVEKLARYIQFDKANFETYSIELAHLLLASSSEVDVLLKELCRLTDDKNRAKNINTYREVVSKSMPSMVNQAVFSRRYGLRLTPWKSWETGRNPEWWRAYNDVKHERSRHFQQANLKNTLHSIAALLIVNLHYALLVLEAEHPGYPYEFRNVISVLHPVSELFRIEDALAYFSD